jgi:hypothetical protein
MVDICTKAIPNLGCTVDLNQSQIKEGKNKKGNIKRDHGGVKWQSI